MKPKILLIEDEKTRESFARRLRKDVAVDVYAPRTFHEFKENVLLEKPDGAVLDIRLPKWHVDEENKQKIDDYSIGNGIDISRFLHENMGVPICLTSAYTTEYKNEIEQLNFKPFVIPKTVYTTPREFRRSFNKVIAATRDSNKSNPQLSITPSEYLRLSPAEQVTLYKTVSKMNRNWMQSLFKEKKNEIDLPWVLIRGRSVTLFGKQDGVKRKKISGVDVDFYPEEHKLLSGNGNGHGQTLPFFFWNTQGVSLSTQFKLAGPGLVNIPADWRISFAIAMAPLCADAYLKGNRLNILKWCREFNDLGQLLVGKKIWKALWNGKKVGLLRQLAQKSREVKIARVVEVFKARVEKIEGHHTAWVELTRWKDSQKLSVEPFDLKRLQESGVKYENQLFEYTVYESGGGSVSMNVEPTSVPGQNPFDSLTEPKVSKA